ncbi:MAG: hypothetical protein ABI680_15340 [Chthoniobacteraceae bacterium]
MNSTPGSQPSADTGSSPFSKWGDCAADCARNEPLKCLSWVFAIGLIASLLPIGRLVGLGVRVLFSLIRPLLIVLGLMKAFEEFDRRRH